MAKRSTFRLQTVLRLRKQAEDECRRRVAGRLRDIARAEMDIGEIEEQTRWEMERSRRDQLDSKMDVMAIRRRRGYMGFLHRRQ
ncbi:MAG: hypothetical protein GY842_17625, partial [bacterium]|nr:hypothetical protein [bacterium]